MPCHPDRVRRSYEGTTIPPFGAAGQDWHTCPTCGTCTHGSALVITLAPCCLAMVRAEAHQQRQADIDRILASRKGTTTGTGQ